MAFFNVCRILLMTCSFLLFIAVTMPTDSHQSRQKGPVPDDSDENYIPIIGILANAARIKVHKYGSEYIRSEFVRFIQMGGGDVVVLETREHSEHYFPKMFNKLNGVFLPGGGADLYYSAFARSATQVMETAKKANDAGDFFPILGVCLGIQFMAALEAGSPAVVELTNSYNMSIPLNLSHSYKESSLFGEAPPHIMEYLTQENLAAHYHKRSLPLKTYNETESINKMYRLLSTNHDKSGVEFVSTMEAYNYPFYGLQWHPEKSAFIKDPALNLSRTSHAIQVGQYVANFIVDQARKNKHRVTELERAQMVLEYNLSSYCLPKSALHDMCGACKCCIAPRNTLLVMCTSIIVTLVSCLVVQYLCSRWPVTFTKLPPNYVMPKVEKSQ